MVGYLLRHSHVLISLAGVLTGIALSLAVRPLRARRRPIAYRRYRRLLIPIILSAAIVVATTALFVPSGRFVVTEWRLAIVQAGVWAVTAFAVFFVPSFFRILVALPVLIVIGASAILWKPMPIVDGQLAQPTGIAVVEERIEVPAGTSTGTAVAILRVRRSPATQEPEILVLPTGTLTPIGETVTTVRSGIVVELELFTPPFGLWWLPPRGMPLRVRIGDVTLVHYPEEGPRTRLLAFLEESGITQRTRYSARYPHDPSQYIQFGAFLVEITKELIHSGSEPDRAVDSP